MTLEINDVPQNMNFFVIDIKIFVIFRCRNRNLLIPQKFYHFLEKQNFVELFFFYNSTENFFTFFSVEIESIIYNHWNSMQKIQTFCAEEENSNFSAEA